MMFTVAKKGKISTMSIRDTFEIEDADGKDVYKIVADMMGRTFQFYNDKDELVAVMAKTKKALLMTVALGSGSESTVDIAAGVDCSVIMAGVFGIGQVGNSILGDVASNYLMDPLKDAAVDGAVDAAGAGDIMDQAAQATNAAGGMVHHLTGVGRFFRDNVFQ